MSSDPILIWTDGSCLGNPGPGGWAWAESVTSFRSGSEEDSTNQRMELMAVIQALLWAPVDREIIVSSDSAYVVSAFQENWHKGWTRSGIKIKNGEQVANWDLWERLIPLVEDRNVRFVKVKGHSGDPMNEFVDDLARTAAGKIKKRK